MLWYGEGMSGWGYALMTVSTLLFWGLVIYGVVALVRYTARTSHQPDASPARPTPAQVLAERFARGDIDEDEYRRRLDVLSVGADRPTTT